ncbi:ABC transporter substrate-binding protein [Parafrankia discariae]|uniref:ABC transporter substrate-binding protein n=1 Tax=Parafrankia discariae TaxID=365528 RepID=UPI001E533EDF|nr:ABC transporter substrate-binding protein [Parafrankia discariae]
MTLVAGACGSAGNDADPSPPPASAAVGTVDLSGVTLNVIDPLHLAEAELGPAGVGDTPYKVNYISVASAAETSAALASGKGDLVLAGDVGFATFAAAGLPIKAIRAVEIPRAWCGIVVPEDSPIHGVRDLVGRKIANLKSAGSEIVAINAFKKEGLSYFDDAEVVDFSSVGDVVAAYRSGQVDAWAGCSAPVYFFVNSGTARFVVDGTTGPWRGDDVWAASDSALADPAREAAVVDFIHRAEAGFEWGNTNVARVAEIQAKLVGAPATILEALYAVGKIKGAPISKEIVDGLTQTHDLEVELGNITAGGNDFSTYITDEYNTRIDNG